MLCVPRVRFISEIWYTRRTWLGQFYAYDHMMSDTGQSLWLVDLGNACSGTPAGTAREGQELKDMQILYSYSQCYMK